MSYLGKTIMACLLVVLLAGCTVRFKAKDLDMQTEPIGGTEGQVFELERIDISGLDSDHT